MSALDLKLNDRALDYVNKLIVKPIVSYGHLQLDEFDLKQLADIIQDTLENTKSSQNLASSFGHYTKTWNIDWHWIAHHITWDYYNIKQAQTIRKMFGSNSQVYKSIDNSHSPDCLELYLTDSSNRKSEPKIFTLSELIENGSNLGKEKKDWKPVIGVTDFGLRKYHPYDNREWEEIEHYYDNTSLSTKSEWEVWDEEEGCYKTEDKPLTERQKKIRSLIKITVKDDNGKVIYSSKDKTENKSTTKQKKQLKWWQKLFK
ncbi:MAG: hypothetical protein WD048_02710 [Chitinophagales bacterium]